MRITSKYNKINKHTLHARLRTASHRFALMIDNYSPDDTEAENGLLMVTGKVFVPGYTDATVTIVYPKRKRATDQSFYYITPTSSTEDMSLAYSDDTFYPRFSDCEQAVKDLPEVTVSQYFYDQGIIPDDPSTFTALTGIPLESQLVNDINEITGEDTNYYTIGANEEHAAIDNLIKDYTDYQDGDQIIPYLDITSQFINNGGTAQRFSNYYAQLIENMMFVDPTDFYNSLTIILRQPSEHPELNNHIMKGDEDWVITITSTFLPNIFDLQCRYSYEQYLLPNDDKINQCIYFLADDYKHSLYSTLDEWASLVTNGVLQLGSKDFLSTELRGEYEQVCTDGKPWFGGVGYYHIDDDKLDGYTPIEGLTGGEFHFTEENITSEELSNMYPNITVLNENPNDNQLYLSALPNPLSDDFSKKETTHQYSTVYYVSNEQNIVSYDVHMQPRIGVFLHLPDSLLSGCLDTAPSWSTLNYLRAQGQQLMNCLQETIMSVSTSTDTGEPNASDEDMVDDESHDLMNRLIALGWTQETSTTISTPMMSDIEMGVKLQFTCIDNTWSLNSVIAECDATGGEVPLPLSDAQLNENITSEDIVAMLEQIADKSLTDITPNSFFSPITSHVLFEVSSDSIDTDNRYAALTAGRNVNHDIHDLSLLDPEFRNNDSFDSEHVYVMRNIMKDYPLISSWVYRILEAFNLPHSFELSDDFNSSRYLSMGNKDYGIRFDLESREEPCLSISHYVDDLVNGDQQWYSALWSDVFKDTSYADFMTILPGVGVALTLLYVFSQSLLDDPQILNNIQRITNNNELTLEPPQGEDDGNQENWQNVDESYWLGQVERCMDQSQVFTRLDETMWKRNTDPISINGIDYSQQLIGEIIVLADPIVEQMRMHAVITETDEAADSAKYERSLIPALLTDILPDISAGNMIEVSAEKINTLIGNSVLNGVLTGEQLTALEENTNDILPWLSNSSTRQVKTLQKVAGCVQYCDKILNNEEIPSLDFISQGLHGNILNILKKNHVTGTTGVDYFLQSFGAVPIKEINGAWDMETGTTVSHAAYDICKYYAIPVKVDGWDNAYCALTFTKQNGKPVCQLQDDYLYMSRNRKYYQGIVHKTGMHLTTLGETFNSLVTGEGIPDYNLLHFLQNQLSNPLQATDAAKQMLEADKEHIQHLMNL